MKLLRYSINYHHYHQFISCDKFERANYIKTRRRIRKRKRRTPKNFAKTEENNKQIPIVSGKCKLIHNYFMKMFIFADVIASFMVSNFINNKEI